MNLPRLIKYIVLMAILMTSGCSTDSEPSPTSPLEPSEIEVPAAKLHWEEVREIAQEWDSGAFVYEVVVNLPLAGEIDETAFFQYYIQSPNQENAYLRIYCDEIHCMSTELSNPSGVFLCKPILREDFEVDSDQVFRMILGLEKRDLISQEGVRTYLTLTRQYEGACQREQVVWIVQHLDAKSSKIYTIVIDASTGKIIESYDE